MAGCLAGAGAASASAAPLYLSVFAGTGTPGTPSAGPALSSDLHHPRGMAVDPTTGDLYIADYSNSDVEQVTPQGTLSVIAGHQTYGTPTPGRATASSLGNPTGVAVNSAGDVFIADPYMNVVEEVTPQGILSIVAGTGAAGAPTPGPATSSALNEPYGVAVDPVTGDLIIADYGNSDVEQVDSQGNLSIIAGTGSFGSPTPGPAAGSALGSPSAVAVDSAGDVFIADPFNSVVEKVTRQGILSIAAGTGAPGAPTPGPATSSELNLPHGVGVDPTTGDLYIADYGNSDVEQVTPQGALSVVAGTGTAGATTPGPASQSQLDQPLGVGVNPTTGELYIADTDNDQIDQVGPLPAPVDGTAPTISGTDRQGQVLTSSNGTWSGSPTGYQHQWQDCSSFGTQCTNISGATGSSYTLTASDVGHTIEVVVVATNPGGSQAASSTPTGVIAASGSGSGSGSGSSHGRSCPAATGRLTATRLGPIALGMTRARARKVLPDYTVTHERLDDFCLAGGRGILAGYPSARLLRSLSPRERAALRGRVVLALSANRRYSFDHITAGARVARLRGRLGHARRFDVHGATWYVMRKGRTTAVAVVLRGTVEEVGIANRALTGTRVSQDRLVRSF